jgi:predicted nuclease of predicted toxin-antitoxin system
VRLVANENFPRRLVSALRQAGHDVTWVTECQPGLSDAGVLGLARSDARIVATFDKDFGALAFESGIPRGPASS